MGVVGVLCVRVCRRAAGFQRAEDLQSDSGARSFLSHRERICLLLGRITDLRWIAMFVLPLPFEGSISSLLFCCITLPSISLYLTHSSFLSFSHIEPSFSAQWNLKINPIPVDIAT